MARINVIASPDGTRQHNQACDALTFRNHFLSSLSVFSHDGAIHALRRKPYSLATFAAIWSAMLNTAAWAGLTEHTATSMATLLLTANAR